MIDHLSIAAPAGKPGLELGWEGKKCEKQIRAEPQNGNSERVGSKAGKMNRSWCEELQVGVDG
jgi:hypothetical protein